MTLVKICGIREREHAEVAADAGADLIGFVFVPVRREVKPKTAAEIVQAVRRGFEAPPKAVGLFVNERAETINRVIRQVGLDLVQLSGDEPPELAGQIDVPVIKAIRLRDGGSMVEARASIVEHLRYCDGVLIDSHVAGQWGGTGVVGDWETAATLAGEFPVILAGGLNPENVAEAIRQVNPAVVDVSSGVETEGRKDSDKIRNFICAARKASKDSAPAFESRALIELIVGERHSPSRSHA